MRIAYFDCFAGASGDMILGAMIDAGLAVEWLSEELGKLKLSNYHLDVRKVKKNGIVGSQAIVDIDQEHHEHHHRQYTDITQIICRSDLGEKIKNKSSGIFKRLAEAEALVHNRQIEEIHFHEVGAMDAIIDVVGAVIGIDALKVDTIICSALHVGTGTVQTTHGTLPIPAPATAELIKGVPAYSNGVFGELLTPTGAAILTTLSSGFGPIPKMKIEQIGYGAGTSEYTIPNLLRLIIGESSN
jgi:uncharacterized protein (TIGR00299 family) protein